MNGPDDSALTPDQRRVRDAVAARTHPRPDPAFRARLRREFTSGQFGPRRRQHAARPWFLRPLWLVPAAAAALVVAGLVGNRGPDWRLLSAHGEGRVLVDGRGYTLDQQAALAAALRRGGDVRTEGAITLDLVAPGMVAVAVGPDTRLALPESPGRWWGREARARLEWGDVYLSTGRSFQGARLSVDTDEMRASVVGTSFAVLRHEDGSCVCVMEGRVRVAAHREGSSVEVPEGMRRIVPPTGPAETAPILDDSAHRLHRQLSSVGGVLGR